MECLSTSSAICEGGVSRHWCIVDSPFCPFTDPVFVFCVSPPPFSSFEPSLCFSSPVCVCVSVPGWQRSPSAAAEITSPCARCGGRGGVPRGVFVCVCSEGLLSLGLIGVPFPFGLTTATPRSCVSSNEALRADLCHSSLLFFLYRGHTSLPRSPHYRPCAFLVLHPLPSAFLLPLLLFVDVV
jgi:hypothetical protein